MNWSNVKTYGALTLVSLLYGINYNVLKIVVPEYVGPFGFIVFRVTIATAVFWMFYFFIREKINWKEDGWRLLLCSITGIAVNQLLFYKGISLTSAVNGSIIMTLTPILTLVWAATLLGEKITRKKIAGILLGLLGAVIIIYKPSSMEVSGDWRGDLLVLANGLSYACYLVIVKPLMMRYKPMTVVTWVFTLAVLIVLPIGFSEASVVDLSILPVKVWYSMTYAIIGVTVVVYFLNVWTLARVNSSVVGAFIYLHPIFATITAILFFSEVFLWKHLVACVLVFLGVWLVTGKNKTAAKPE
ncbi:MAG: DMT family transporter [Cyclobacteriaceae bacterium]